MYDFLKQSFETPPIIDAAIERIIPWIKPYAFTSLPSDDVSISIPISELEYESKIYDRLLNKTSL